MLIWIVCECEPLLALLLFIFIVVSLQLFLFIVVVAFRCFFVACLHLNDACQQHKASKFLSNSPLSLSFSLSVLLADSSQLGSSKK
jgi:hypothetical protein